MIKRTLYFGNPSYLSLRNTQLVLRLPEVSNNDTLPDTFKKEAERTIPIEDIGVVVLDHSQITITQGLLEALLENNCAIITCDKSRLPVGLILPLCGNTTQNERFRDQLNASLPLKKQLWQQTVQQKIANQAAILESQGIIAKNMRAWVGEVRSGDIDNMEARLPPIIGRVYSLTSIVFAETETAILPTIYSIMVMPFFGLLSLGRSLLADCYLLWAYIIITVIMHIVWPMM